LKRIKELPLELAEKIELPGEIIPGTGSISVIAGRRALVEGYRALLEYSAERVVLALERGKIIIGGAALSIRAMNAGAIVISGRIETMEWER